MTSINSSILASTKLRDPEVFRETISVANVEQSFTFPTGMKRYSLVNRSARIIKYAWDMGTSGTVYNSLLPNAPLEVSGVSQNSLTIYFQSTASGGVLEIETWLS